MAGELDRAIDQMLTSARCLEAQLEAAKLSIESAEQQLELLRQNATLLKGLTYKVNEGVNHD